MARSAAGAISLQRVTAAWWQALGTLARPNIACLLAALLTVGMLAPFTGKAFHIDDPLFVWTARQIHQRPFDFYGFPVNWYGIEMPMSDVNKNPPLVAYYIAAAAAVGGWTERTLHLAFLLPALLVVVGTHQLAARLCEWPAVAAVMVALSPGFVVSASTVMSDVMMLAFWVWATVLWIDGIEQESFPRLAGAGVLVLAAALTKYFGAGLLPLLALYAVLRRGWRASWMAALALPVLGLGGYQWMTAAAYGRGLLFDAASYATSVRFRSGVGVLSKTLTGLAFTGGCLAGIALSALLTLPRRLAMFVVLLVPAVGVSILSMGGFGQQSLVGVEGVRWGFIVQSALFAGAGVCVLALAVVDIWTRRDAASALLLGWVLGTFIFATFLNWSVNARSVLPLVPAAAILLARRFDGRFIGSLRWRVAAGAVLATAIGLMVAWADHQLANSARWAAQSIAQRYAASGAAVWFQGHWGFQYYMEALGGRPVDRQTSRLSMGDVMIIPMNNTNLFPVPREAVQAREILEFPVPSFVTTMSSAVGAGHYADVWGPLPFAFGRVPPERYLVLAIGREFTPPVSTATTTAGAT